MGKSMNSFTQSLLVTIAISFGSIYTTESLNVETNCLNTSVKTLQNLSVSLDQAYYKIENEVIDHICKNQLEKFNNPDNYQNDTCVYPLITTLGYINNLVSVLTMQAKFLLGLGINYDINILKSAINNYKLDTLYETTEKWRNDTTRANNAIMISPENVSIELQESIKEFEKLLEYIETELLCVHTNVVPKFTAMLIQNGDVEQAWQQLSSVNSCFRHLYEYSAFKTGIQLAFSKNINYFDIVLKFINGAPDCSLKMVGYSTLLQELQIPDASPEILILTGYMKNHCNHTFVIGNIHPVHIMIRWASDIRNGQYQRIHLFFKKYLNKGEELEILNGYLEEILETTYISIGEGTFNYSIDNFEKILEFVYGLPSVTSQVIGYRTVYQHFNKNRMTHSMEMLRFAYRVKEMIINYKNISDKLFKEMKELIPLTFWKIVSGDICYIKNTRYNEFLYASNIKHPFFGNRKVYTWIPGSKVDEGKWKFEAVDSGRYFLIISYYWINDRLNNRYLCDEMNGSRDKILVKTCSYRNLWWKLEPVLDNNGKPVFNIKRMGERLLEKGKREIVEAAMYAGNTKTDSRDASRRIVYNSAMNVSLPASHWEILC